MKLIEKVTYGWGRTNPHKHKILFPKNVSELIEIFKTNSKKKEKYTLLGGGHAFYDMATSRYNKLICLKNINRIIDFNENNKTLTIESGTTVRDIINFLKDKNYILASLPGTLNATVGGIISNNSHGKDVKYGNFSNRIISLKILLTDGNVMKVKNNEELFNYIVSHAGLLCIILEVKIKLIQGYSYSNLINKKIVVFNNLYECIELLNKANDEEYNGAWIDAFSKDYRGIFINGRWSTKKKKLEDISVVEKQYFFNKVFLNIFFFFTSIFINRIFIKFANYFLYIHTKYLKQKTEKLNFNSFYFYHESKIVDIPRIFPKGYFEIQLLVERENTKLLLEILDLCKKYKLESWLCGIKKHQKDHFPNSFSANGYDITITFPFKKIQTKSFKLFYDELKKYIFKKNIIFNLAKDSILEKKTFHAMYPNFKELIKLKKELDKDFILTNDFYYRLMG